MTLSGNFTNPTANTAATATVAGLTASTTYDVYVVAEDAVPNLQTSATLLTVTTAAPMPTIATGTISSTPVCATTATDVTVNYTTTNSPTGTFTAQLSGPTGIFPATPTTLATVSATSSSLTVTIPAGTASGTGYQIRVVTPSTTGSPSATFTVVSNPTVVIAPAAVQNIATSTNGTALVATETPSAGVVSRAWFYGTVSGTYATATGVTTTSYTPNFATAGTYFVVLKTVFAGCGEVVSAPVQINVTVPLAINTPTFATAALCAVSAATLDVTFTASGAYDPTNVFTIQLSNASGSFSSPVTIGSIANNLNTAQTVTTTIPAATANGTGYKIRVVASTPAITSTGTSASLTVVGTPSVSIAPTTNQSIVAGANGSTLTATEVLSIASNTRVWQVSTTSATTGFTNITPAQTGTTYVPNFAAVGVYFVRVQSTIAGCAAVTSNAVQITVTSAPAPTISSLTINAGFAGSTIPTFTVNGSLYVSGAVVYFDGVAQPTTFATAGRLTVANLTLPTTPGPYNVTVVNPGGNTSNAVVFTVMPAPLVAYKTTGLTGSTASISPLIVAANSSASILTRTATINAVTGSDVYSSNGFDATGATTPDLTKYLTFTYTVAAGYNASLTNVVISFSRSSAAAPQNVELRVSTDGVGFTNPVSLGTQTLPTATTQFTFTPPANTLQAVTVPLYFRLYAYNGTNAASNIRLDDITTSIPAVIVNGTVAVGAPAPEINLAQGVTNLLSGTGSYAFATTRVSSSTATVPFDIQNTGNAVLNLTGTPLVAISGNVADFTLTQPTTATATVAGGTSLPFTIAFNPTSTGTKMATISIANNDSDENPYTFTVTGTGVVAPVITSFSPTSGPVGTSVAITGTDFTASTTVSFNGTAATAVTFNSTISLTAIVPVGATTGAITVANTYGSSTSAASFTVTVSPTAGLLLLEDNFAYAASEPLTSHGWTSYSGSGAPATIAGNLTQAQYPRGFDQSTPATFAGSSSARLTITDTQDVSRAFGTATTSTLYAAAVINMAETSSGGDYFLTFTTATNNSFRGRIFMQRQGINAAGTFQFGVSAGASVGTYTTGTPFTTGTPYLVVLKYTTAGSTQTASLFVYTGVADLNEPATPLLTVTEPLATGLDPLVNVALRQAENGLAIDGLRVGTNWGTTIGRPVYVDEAAVLRAGSYYSVALSGTATTLATSGATTVEGNLSLGGGIISTSATNTLRLETSATTSGGSATSFVNGPLARTTGTGAATTVFPIGKGTAYRPLTLTATSQTSTTTYTGEVLNASARATGVDAPLVRVSNIRYASITPDVQPTGFSGTLTMPFGTDDYVTDPQASSLVMAKRDGSGNWQTIGRTSATGTATGGNVSGDLTSAPFVSFSDFALASTDAGSNNQLTSNPLPVELTAFAAQRQSDKSVSVRWTTASEKNADRFEVQRSLNGRDFATVATAKAQGSTTQATAYTALDATAPAAQLYYRLRQLDLDGTATYSPIATVAGTSATAKLLLYPNPAHSSISFATEAATSYRVLNQLGQAVLHGTTEAGTTNVAVEQLPTGLYFIELQTATGRAVQKFEKE